MLTSGLGILALIGWSIGQTTLASFGDDLVPMAPSTAIILVFMGGVFAAWNRFPQKRWVILASVIINLLAGGVGMILFWSSYLRVYLPIEHLGFQVVQSDGEFLLGHISPATAACVVLCSVSFLLAVQTSPGRFKRLAVSLGISTVAILGVALLLVGYLYASPIMYGSEFIPTALPTALAFLFLSLGLNINIGSHVWPAGGHVELSSYRGSYALLLVFILLVSGIIAGGYVVYRSYERNVRSEIELQLSAIAKLKVDELVDYRNGWKGEISLLTDNNVFSSLTRRYLETSNEAEVSLNLAGWLSRFTSQLEYELVLLVDGHGIVRMSVPAGRGPVDTFLVQRARGAMTSLGPSFVDFYRNEQDGKVYLAILVPIKSDRNSDRTLGVIAFRIDPHKYLYPYISAWPTSSRTAETLILRREGEFAVSLNDLRFRDSSALNLRFHLTDHRVVGVKAALGEIGIVEGLDYRGHKVIADVRPVPESPWHLVARMDVDEAYAPLRDRLWFLVVLVGALVLGTGAGFGMVWRHQRSRYFQQLSASADDLRESEKRYALANRATFSVIWDWDLLSDALVWNESLQSVFGYRQDEIKPDINSWIFLIHPGDIERVKAGMRAAIDSGQPSWTGEYRFLKKDGSYATVINRGFISRSADGTALRVIGAIEDITERKRGEVALHESKKLLEGVINAIPVRVFWKDKDLVYLGCNAMFARDAGFSDPQDVIGKTDFEMGWRDQADLYRKDDLQVIESGLSKLLVEEPQTTPDGNTITLLTSKVPLRSATGEVIGVIGTYMDITERKRAEEGRMSLEVQLRQAQKLESLGTLSSGIAHDFNNILAIILAHSTLLESLPADPVLLAKNMAAISRAVMRGTNLVKQLLTFARKSEVSVELLSLNDVIQEVAKLLGETFPKSIIVKLHLENALPHIEADSTQLHQVIINLCVNARDAMPSGGILTISSMRVDTERMLAINVQAEHKQHILLSVSDTGAGMDEDVRLRIFDPFFTTKARGKGTGLGLALVFGIMESHKGFVDVKSKTGAGSTFLCYFPAASKTIEADVAEAWPKVDEQGGSETILFVEDEEELRVPIVGILKAKGYTVIEAGDGEEALALFRKNRDGIQLIISDLDLPKMNGAELFREVKGERDHVSFILASGYFEPGLRTKLLDEGVRDLLQKPYYAGDVLRSTRHALEE